MLLIRVSVLILFVVVTYADVKPDAILNTAQKRQDDDCNCESIGPWKPVFKPSPIEHSELPEHHQHNIFDIYSTRSDLKLVPHILVPVVNPVAYTLHHDFGSQEQPKLKYSLLDSSVTESTDVNGKPVIKWEHYGDIKQITFKYDGDSHKNIKNKPLDNHKLEKSTPLTDSHENSFKETHSKEEERHTNHSGENYNEDEDETPCEESNEEDEKYFNSESFFDENISSQEDLDVDKDFGNLKDSSLEDNFSTAFNVQSNLGDKNTELPKYDTIPKKTATSYASISSIFSGIKPSYYNDLNIHHAPPVKSSYSNSFTNLNGHGHANFVNHGKSNWFKHLNPMFNEGKSNKYRQKIIPYSVYEHQPEEIRSYGYSKYSDSDENYYPLNKEYLLGDFWKNARKMEKMKPPPLGQTPTWFMKVKNKKPRTISFNRGDLINNNKPFSYVYIIKTNKESKPVFINHK